MLAELSDLMQSRSSRTLAVPRKEKSPLWHLDLYLRDNSTDVLKFDFRGKESLLSQFSVTDSAIVLSGKQCAKSDSAPASCVESGSPRSYYRA